ENSNCAIENTQGTLNLHGEVNVTRGVKDVDLVAFPETGISSGGHGTTALLLLLHPVSGGCAVVGLAYLAFYVCVDQDPLGGGALTSVDVRHDADVANLLQVLKHFLCHG